MPLPDRARTKRLQGHVLCSCLLDICDWHEQLVQIVLDWGSGCFQSGGVTILHGDAKRIACFSVVQQHLQSQISISETEPTAKPTPADKAATPCISRRDGLTGGCAVRLSAGNEFLTCSTKGESFLYLWIFVATTCAHGGHEGLILLPEMFAETSLTKQAPACARTPLYLKQDGRRGGESSNPVLPCTRLPSSQEAGSRISHRKTKLQAW